MAIPEEFRTAFKDEAQFTSDFLIPLLGRMGYSMVVNYHGASELGKDLVFGEVDRFGLVVYHGLQAKYEESISLNGVESLISDAKQAFHSAFQHPLRGGEERISSFIAVNGGSVSDQARKHYFDSLRPLWGPNVRLLDGKDLTTLNRLATSAGNTFVMERLTTLLVEVSGNSNIAAALKDGLPAPLDGRPRYSVDRFRDNAASAYLGQPLSLDLDLYKIVHRYQGSVIAANECLASIGAPVSLPEWQWDRVNSALGFADKVIRDGQEITAHVNNLLAALSSVATL